MTVTVTVMIMILRAGANPERPDLRLSRLGSDIFVASDILIIRHA